ncbi:MAG: type II secretion system ATPase GspE [Gammaproteobacteria bacterium]|nr:type II secretion system ATPase GspE [Gammaproteobacteria bacterium]
MDELSPVVTAISNNAKQARSIDSVDSIDLLQQLPFGFAKRHNLLLQWEQGKPLLYHYAHIPLSLIAEVRRSIGSPLQLQLIERTRFDQMLQQTYEQSQNESMQLIGEMDKDLNLQEVAGQLSEPEDLLESDDDAPIIRLINAILSEAIREEASDIHIETFENRMVIRFRVDGVLREVLQPQKQMAPLLVSRIKVMAKLDIAEKRLPQDGRISLRIAGRAVDVRVSTLPSGNGERIVLRLLDKQAGRLDLEQMGMSDDIRQQLHHLIHQPHGIVLVTGPTGSGKTTTLYAGLGQLNTQRQNVLTIEDPIEYFLDGIGQTPVNAKVDMTFARGLRAILRQDPDVVMVGEIRDLETVQIAVQASLTGHLVLSTLHTNTAVGAVTRLRDMGVEPFLLSSSLIGVLSQRLVRLLCESCREPYEPSDADYQLLGIKSTQSNTLYRAGDGCEQCSHTGYKGRTGIYELISIDEHMRSMIHEGASEQKLEKYARKHSRALMQDGLRRVLNGDTSLDEVLRVTQSD